MQQYNPIQATEPVGASLSKINNGILTAITQSAGAQFPTENIRAGQPCYRTDLKQLFTCRDANTPVWELIWDFNLSQAPSATVATKWKTARTLELTGDVTGSVTIDGSGNMTLSTTIDDANHSHNIGHISGLRNELDGKVDNSDGRLSDAREWTAETATKQQAEDATGEERLAWTSKAIHQAIAKANSGLKPSDIGAVAKTDQWVSDFGRYDGDTVANDKVVEIPITLVTGSQRARFLIAEYESDQPYSTVWLYGTLLFGSSRRVETSNTFHINVTTGAQPDTFSSRKYTIQGTDISELEVYTESKDGKAYVRIYASISSPWKGLYLDAKWRKSYGTLKVWQQGKVLATGTTEYNDFTIPGVKVNRYANRNVAEGATRNVGALADKDKVSWLSDILNSPHSTQFFDPFTRDLDGWEVVEGNSETEVVKTDDTAGSLLRIGNNDGNDQLRLLHKDALPFNPNSLYRVRCRIRRTQGTGTCFLGLAGVTKDGTFADENGNNYFTAQHYVAANDVSPPAEWETYTGYVKGHAAAGVKSDSRTKPNILQPGNANHRVKLFRPMILVNYNNKPGTFEVDYFSVDVVPEETLWEGVKGRPKNLSELDASAGAKLEKITENFGSKSDSHRLKSDTAIVYREIFDNDMSRWALAEGSFSNSEIIAKPDTRGNKVYRSGTNTNGNDTNRLIGTDIIPFDPDVLYQVSIRLRRVAGSGKCYVGVAGRAADGTVVNANGANSPSYNHYLVLQGGEPGNTFQTYTGYLKGKVPPGTNAEITQSNDPKNPGKLHNNAVAFSPFLLTNHDGYGEYEIDWMEIIANPDLSPEPTIVRLEGNSLKVSHKVVCDFNLANQSVTFKGNVSMPSWTVTSDKRLKDNIEALDPAESARLLNMIGEFSYDIPSRNLKHQIGLIAQEFEEAGAGHVVRTDENGEYSLDYRAVAVLLQSARKHDVARIDKLEKRMSKGVL